MSRRGRSKRTWGGLRTPNAFVVLVVLIPAVYFAVAFLVAVSTDVFMAETRPKFATLYALLAAVAGMADFYRLKYDQESRVWLTSSPFVRAAIRGHLVTFLLIGLGVGAAVLLDIDTGWPVVLGILCGPVVGRALALFQDAVFLAVLPVFALISEAFVSLLVLYFVLGLCVGLVSR